MSRPGMIRLDEALYDVHLSPSQLDLAAGAEGCERKWWYRYVAGRKKPPSTADQQHGIDFHSVAERWLKCGETPGDDVAGRAFRQAIHLLPPPDPAHEVEAPFALDLGSADPKLEGAALVGFIDLFATPAGGPSVLIVDHKTTKDLRWAKSEEDLRADPQAVVYAVRAFQRGARRIVETRWVYSAFDRKLGRAKGARAVSVEWTEESLLPAWQKILATSERLVQLRRAGKDAGPETAVANEAACGAYGGCEFAAECPVVRESRQKGFGGIDKRVDAPERAGVIDSRNISVEATTMATAAGGGSGSLLDRIKKMGGGGGKPNGAPADPVNPPGEDTGDPGTRVSPAVAEPVTEEEVSAKGVPGGVKLPGRGGPKSAPRPEKPAPTSRPDAAPPRAAEAGRKPFVLLVDAVVAKGRESVNLIDLPQVRRALAGVGAQAEGGHWSCVEYGKGPGLLAAALDAELDVEPVSGFVAVDGATAEARALLSVLVARADVVVRAVRG